MGERQILFLAHQFMSLDVVGNPTTHEITDKPNDRYASMHALLQRYGEVNKQRTSGVMTRITPPEGAIRVDPDGETTYFEEPASAPLTREEREANEIMQRQRALLTSVSVAHVVVAAVDGESETRGMLIEHAWNLGKPILLLQQAVPMLKLPTRPLYRHRPGITFVMYKDENAMKIALAQFFSRFAIPQIA